MIKLILFQESELDTPPEQIPSQTFTNQNFMPGPPQPMQLPPHFPPFQANPTNHPPPPAGNGMTIEETPITNSNQTEDAMKSRERQPRLSNQTFFQNNNGYNRPRQNNRNGPRPNNRSNQ